MVQFVEERSAEGVEGFGAVKGYCGNCMLEMSIMCGEEGRFILSMYRIACVLKPTPGFGVETFMNSYAGSSVE